MERQSPYIAETLYQRSDDSNAFDRWYNNRGLSEGDLIGVSLRDGNSITGEVTRSGRDGVELRLTLSDGPGTKKMFLTTQDDPCEPTYFKGPVEDYIWGSAVDCIVKYCMRRK